LSKQIAKKLLNFEFEKGVLEAISELGKWAAPPTPKLGIINLL
jgi:hypothetical protein